MSTARCDLTDLLTDQCACPQHRGEPAPAQEPAETTGQPFPARFPGRCGTCDGQIHEGDQIARLADGSGYAHAYHQEYR